MIARNAWRLVEEPESLWGMMLKAKYFKNSDFLNSKCPKSASWAWKCLHQIKEKIKPFITWIVGDGKFIDPWCDRWIPEIGTAQPKQNTNPEPTLKVADFIDQETRTWNRSKLHMHFDQSFIERIVAIPLSSATSRDRRAWELTRDGVFTSKSAYFGLRTQRNQTSEEIWKAIWRTKLPHRIQLFIWKGAKNAIPVRDILYKRMNIGDNRCPRCNQDTETVIHALVTCPYVSRIWQSSILHTTTEQFRDKSLLEWLKFWLGIDPYRRNTNLPEEFPFVACLMWSIWMSRNDLLHNNHLQSDQFILNRALKMTPLHQNPVRQIIATGDSEPHTTSAWRPSRNGWTKINTDGAWDPINLKGGLGFIIRDCLGTFKFAAAVPTNVSSAEEAEIRAIWIAMKKAVELGIKTLEIEGDAAVVVEQLQRRNYRGSWNTEAFLRDIEVWSTNFEKLSFNYCPRLCNSVAHELAQWAKNSQYSMFWASPPMWLIPALGRDHTLF
ncbi:Reverse transcriptase zinc-binding domain [Macleaya cordata]|uniref:Reverse transcriptase zinc-binding domain n=1 Tax=Macleaya cordata TaxID=56857 RepID=A0A200PSU0_MACCD|nr:Reverse transcriptase zinc-binding domain [Macleaya cordata]